MKDFLFHKRDDAQPTPVVPETPETPETPVTPETLAAPEVTEVPETPEVCETPEEPEVPKEEVSTAYLLERLEAIQKDTAYLKEAMDKISQMERGDETRAMALSNMVVTREETNQRLIEIYSGMLYRKLPPKMPNFDGWGKKWSDWGQKVKKSVELTPEQDAELKRQIDEAAQTLDGWGKKWSDWGQKVKKSVELTPEQDAELKRQIDEAAQTLQDATKDLKNAAKRGGESVQHYVSDAITAIRRATNGKKESGSTLDMVTAILRDSSLSAEEKELVLDRAEEIRDLEESVQIKVMEILGDASLSLEEKELILDHLEDLQELS